MSVASSSHCAPGPQVWECSYKREFILASDESAGMVQQCALSRNKLLVDRAPQLIKSFVKKDEVALEDASCKVLLEGPFSVPSSVAACSTPTHRGEKNESFSLAARALAKGGKAAGYTSRRKFLMSMLTLPACQKTPRPRASHSWATCCKRCVAENGRQSWPQKDPYFLH